jgi:hypothetical protein
LSLLTVLSLPETARGAPPIAETPGKGSRLFPPRLSVGHLVYLPQVGYSSETSFAGGGKFRLSFPSPGNGGSVSDINLKLLATFKAQYEAELVSNLNFSSGNGLKAKVSYSSIPLRFYGIGPDTPLSNEEVYQPQSIRAYIELFQKLFSRLRIGLRYEYEEVDILQRKDGGILHSGNIKGTEGDPIHGVGLLLDWDTRDNKNSPTSGSYYQAFALMFGHYLGGEHEFNNYNVDLRNYFSLSEGHVLATQVFFYAAKGNAPFWRYAALGGRAHTRGYRKGRYLDRILLSFQGEYRLQIWKRVGLVAFGGLGDVSSSLDRLRLEHMRPTVGGGLRYTLNAEDGVKARFDVAFGQDTARLYLSFDEAF